MKSKNIIAGVLFCFGGLLIVSTTLVSISAANSNQVKINTVKVTRTYQDVIASPENVDFEAHARRVDLGVSLPAGAEILSLIARIGGGNGFSTGSVGATYTITVNDAGGGRLADISSGNLDGSSDGTDIIHNNNDFGDRFQIYSFADSLPLQAIIRPDDETVDLAELIQGAVDFYIAYIVH